MVPRTLLIVDDTPSLGAMLRDAVPLSQIVTADDSGAVLAQVRQHRPAIVTLPVPSADSDRLGILTEILAEAPSTKVIALTPADQRVLAVRAVARGAHDICCTPLDTAELTATIRRAFHRADLELEGRRLDNGDAPPTLRVLREDTERRAMLAALARSGGNLSATARLLGVSRPTLYALLRQHGVRTD